MYHRYRDDSISRLGETDMSQDKAGQQWSGSEAKIPRGLIIFDRGFNRRKVFEAVVEVGHHILCRAKSNAVFYRLPLVAKQPKRGRPKKYGKRTQLRYLLCSY